MVPSPRLVTGIPSLALLEIRGATLALKQDPSGAWNVAPLLQRLRSRRGGGETFIGALRIRETSLRVNDRLFPVMDVSLRDLATRGSRDASWQVSFADQTRHPVTITGRLRPGTSPAMTLAVDAPEVALKGLAGFMALPPALDLDRGTAALHLTASFGNDLLTATGVLTFAGVSARLKERAIPLTGTLDLAGEYRTDRDEARISRGSVTLAGLTALSGTALIRQVEERSRFFRRTRIRRSGPRHPAGTPCPRWHERVGRHGNGDPHETLPRRQRPAGADGRTATMALRNGNASWQGRPLVREMAADLSLTRKADGWKVTGPITSGGAGSPAELQSLHASLTATLSPRFTPLQVEIAPLSGVVRGIGLAGEHPLRRIGR